MKKIFNFSKRRKASPSASETNSVLSVGYDLKEKGLSKVHKAAFTGDVAKLKQLAKKKDLNQLDEENRTALHIACVYGHTEVVQYLVENKAKLNLCDNQNRSALMKAVQCQQDHCVSILLEHEADPNLVDINGNTALHLVACIPSLPMAMKLLDHKANINAQNKEGNSPLILSVKEDHAEMAEFLLKEGADINLQNKEQRTPLLIASCNGQISMVQLLLQYNADITVKDNKGWSSDDYALMNGHHACSHLITEHETKRKPLQSPSYLAFNKSKQPSLLGSPEAGFVLGAPDLRKDGTEDNSHAESISRESESGPVDSWPSRDADADDDELDLGLKKPQKLNLKKLMSTFQIKGKTFSVDENPDKSWSDTESEPISEGNAVEQKGFLGSNTYTQHPATPQPISFSNLPQMTSHTSLQKEGEEKSPLEDDYEKEEHLDEEYEEDVDEECDEVESKSSEHLQMRETSKERDFFSELGIEKENEEEDSPWDSESDSDSPSKKEHRGLNSLNKSHKPISSISEESNAALHYIPSFLSVSNHNSVLRSVARPGGQKPIDCLDCDSTTTSETSKNLPVYKPKELVQEQELGSSAAETQGAAKSEKEKGHESSLKGTRQLPVSDEDSDWDTDSISSSAKMTTPLPHIVDAKKVPPLEEDQESDCSSEASEHPEEERATLEIDAHAIELSSLNQLALCVSQTAEKEEDKNKKEDMANTSFHESTWSQRYEKIWVEIEKKETKSRYKNVAAELKQKFGEREPMEQSEPVQDTEAKEVKAANEDMKKDTRISLCVSEEDSSDEEELIVRPSTQTRSVKLLPILKRIGLKRTQEESYTEHLENNDFAKHKDIQQHSSETRDITTHVREHNSYQGSSYSADSNSNLIENKQNLRLAPLGDHETLNAMNQESFQEAGISLLHMVEEESVFSSMPDAVSCKSDELVEEGLQRSTTEGDVAKAGVTTGGPVSSALWNTGSSGEQTDIDQVRGKKTDTIPDRPNPKQEGMRDNGLQPKDDALKKRDLVSPKWPSRSPKRFPSTQCSGPSTEEKNGGELEMTDDFEDLTQSSDTTSEELDCATPGYFNTSLLIKQLEISTLDSVSMVKLQNIFHEYEHTIQKERDRHSRLAEKVSQLKQEQNELKHLLNESRDSISSLEHLRLELETDLSNLKFLLKQEQEKHLSASMLYDKTREQLSRKEEQHQYEIEEREKGELKMRNLELEFRALTNNMKQLEEDRNETQRLLAHEKNARALQADLLNSHLRKQQDIEERKLRNFTNRNELTEASEHERELQQQVCILQDELGSLRVELEHFRSLSQQEESRLADERDALRERLEDAQRDLKLNDETLAQTVFQYNGQMSTLKAECVLLNTKLEHEKQVRQQLEAEAESSKARLLAALQETERCQAVRAETERTLQREREQHQRSEEKWTSESSTQRDTIQSLSQKLIEVEARANSQELECHRTTLSVAEKNALLEMAVREREQAQVRLEELERTLQNERDRASRATARHDALQERLVQIQSEGVLLKQQLEEVQNRVTAKDVTDVQDCFTQALNQLRASGEERVQLVEERSKELASKNAELREQNYRLEQEKADREMSLRQLQQELANTLKKLSMCEASLEVNTRYRSDLEEEKMRAQKDMERLKGKLQDSEEHNMDVERRINSLMGALDEKERDLNNTGQKLQEVLAASTHTEQTIKQLDEAVQRLEIENARLEATVKQQNNRIEILQKGAQEATAVQNHLEKLLTNLESSKMTLEEQLSHEVQKQSMLSSNVHDSQVLWEEELKNQSRLGQRLAKLEKEKGELINQMKLEKKKAKKIAEQKKTVDARLDQEMNRNNELQKEMCRLRTLVKSAKKQLQGQNIGEQISPLGNLRGEISYRQNETEESFSRMKIKVDELQVQLEQEALRCSKLEDMNRELKMQLNSLKSLEHSHECLERNKQQLEEEVKALRKRLEAGVMDQNEAMHFRKETEMRARQEIQQKLDDVNLFLQTQAASQEVLEQMKASNDKSQRAELEQRIRELEAELSHAHTSKQASLLQRDSTRTELEHYRQLYNDELRHRKSLAAKLERSNRRLAENRAMLLSEKERSMSFLSSAVINGNLASTALDTQPSLGGLGLGVSPLSHVREHHQSCVETFLAKIQSDLEKSISTELNYGTCELEGTSTRLSPVGSVCGSQKNLNSALNVVQQDPLKRATHQYLEVLKKNYMI